MEVILFHKSSLQAMMGVREDACTDQMYDTECHMEMDLPRNKTQENKDFYLPHISVFIYFMNWLIFIQGH